MVDAAKILVYYAGDRESLGKDFEAAMALSRGKPVIVYCEDEEKERLYRDVHPTDASHRVRYWRRSWRDGDEQSKDCCKPCWKNTDESDGIRHLKDGA